MSLLIMFLVLKWYLADYYGSIDWKETAKQIMMEIE